MTAGIAGLPAAGFPGPITFLTMFDAATLQWGTSDFTVLAVARATAQTASDGMLYVKEGPDPYDGPALFLNSDKPAPSTLAAAQISGAIYVESVPPPTTFVDSSVHLLAARRAGSTLEIRVDAAVSQSLTSMAIATTDVSAPGSDVMIGQNGYTPTFEFQQFHGEIAEIVGIVGSVEVDELSDVEQYLKSRYAIP
jgi:hypothetical protein